VLAACASSGDTIDGTITLVDSDGDMGSWDSCEGDGGFADFSDGTSVSIDDQDGRRIGASSLENVTAAHIQELGDELPDEMGDSAQEALDLMENLEGILCVFTFHADSVEDAEIYVIEVGSRRGEQSYTKEDMEANNWRVFLSIGDL
jgi:hypothetical protein